MGAESGCGSRLPSYRQGSHQRLTIANTSSPSSDLPRLVLLAAKTELAGFQPDVHDGCGNGIVLELVHEFVGILKLKVSSQFFLSIHQVFRAT